MRVLKTERSCPRTVWCLVRIDLTISFISSQLIPISSSVSLCAKNTKLCTIGGMGPNGIDRTQILGCVTAILNEGFLNSIRRQTAGPFYNDAAAKIQNSNCQNTCIRAWHMGVQH